MLPDGTAEPVQPNSAELKKKTTNLVISGPMLELYRTSRLIRAIHAAPLTEKSCRFYIEVAQASVGFLVLTSDSDSCSIRNEGCEFVSVMACTLNAFEDRGQHSMPAAESRRTR